MAEERKADKLAKEGTAAGKLKDRRIRQDNRLNEIMNEIDTGTARKQIK